MRRRNPTHRPPPATPAGQISEPKDYPAPKRGGRWIVAGALAVVLVLAAVWLAGWMVTSRPDRGQADTVSHYAARSYENASWEVVRKAASLGDLSKLGTRRKALELSRIYGFDSDNMWLVDAKGAVFRLERGHWGLAAELPDLGRHPHGRILDRDTLLVGGQYGRGAHKIHRIGAEGIRSFELQHGEQARDRSRPLERGDAIIPFAPGITYIATGSDYTGTSHKLEGDELKVLHPAKGHPESVIVDTDGTPIQLKSGRVPVPKLQDLWLAEVFSEGDVLAIARFTNRSRDLLPPMLVRYRSGTWVRSEEIPLDNTFHYRTGWLSRTDEGMAFCVFAGKGQVALYREGEGITYHPIGTATSATVPDLIDAWGESPDRFWVMDRSGGVWEHHENRWRHVVRGMIEDDVLFNHSWISPEGTAYAITGDTLYKLD